jgi:hypothetical protein
MWCSDAEAARWSTKLWNLETVKAWIMENWNPGTLEMRKDPMQQVEK